MFPFKQFPFNEKIKESCELKLSFFIIRFIRDFIIVFAASVGFECLYNGFGGLDIPEYTLNRNIS